MNRGHAAASLLYARLSIKLTPNECVCAGGLTECCGLDLTSISPLPSCGEILLAKIHFFVRCVRWVHWLFDNGMPVPLKLAP
jgi:hypothetical protein